MAESGPLATTLAGILADGGPDAPGRIADASVHVLGVDHAAIVLMGGPDRQEPLHVSDPVAGRLDELQFSLGEGPCVEAFVGRRPVLVADVEGSARSRWPVFAASVREIGVRAIFVLPLQVGTTTVGVLELSRDTPGELGAEELAGALSAADATFWSLLGIAGNGGGPGVSIRDAATDPTGWIVGLPLDRTEVHQATGMASEQLRAPPAVALSAMRAHAFVHGTTISQVADDVVARKIRFDRETR